MSAPSRSRQILTTAAVAAALAVCLPGPTASAAALATDDAAGDVWIDSFDPESGQSTYTAAGSVANVDVLATRVRHTSTRIVLVTSYDELVRSGPDFAVADRLRFNAGPRVTLFMDASGRRSGAVLMTNDRTMREVDCRGLRHEVDYDANTVTMSFPRSCVGSPRTVEVSSVAYGADQQDTPDREDDLYYLDNAHNTGHGLNGWFGPVRTG